MYSVHTWSLQRGCHGHYGVYSGGVEMREGIKCAAHQPTLCATMMIVYEGCYGNPP